MIDNLRLVLLVCRQLRTLYETEMSLKEEKI